ncbi:hypothetical protein Tco_1345402, partial [Tanacetum coccineum]
PSESEDFFDNESECDMPVCDDFTTFSNPLFDSDDGFSSNDDESFSDEDVPMENFKIYSNPLFDDEEIISPKIDPHYFNAMSNLIESLLNRDILIDSSPKFDYLLKELSGELAHIDLIWILLIRFLSLSLHLLSSLRIVTLIWRRSTYFLLQMTRCHRALRMTIMTRKGIFPDTGVVTNKVVGDISEHDVLMPNLLPTQPTLCPVFDLLLLFSSENEDKVFNPGILISPLLSHRGEIISNFSKSPMMISGGDIPHLDVPFLHFYPP